MRYKLNVTGMTCAACSARVEKVAGAVPGVDCADVNLLQNTLWVQVKDEEVLGDVVEAVKTSVTPKIIKIVTIASLSFYCLAKSYSFFTGNEFNGLHSIISSGTPGNFLSGGLILPLNIAVGCVVCCTMYSFYMLFKRGRLD